MVLVAVAATAAAAAVANGGTGGGCTAGGGGGCTDGSGTDGGSRENVDDRAQQEICLEAGPLGARASAGLSACVSSSTF